LGQLKFSIGRNYGETNFLTGIRAVAIILVFLIHSGGGGLRQLGDIGNEIVDFGKYGVQMFFVLSGYTIFSQLYKEKYELGSFLVMRLLRISTPYFPLLFLVSLYIGFGGPGFNGWTSELAGGTISLMNLLSHLTYTSEFFLPYQNTILGVEWTLGIEVFFYFVIGIAISLRLIRTKWSSLLLWTFSLIVLAFLPKLFRPFFEPNMLYWNWTPLHYGAMFIVGGICFHLRSSWSSFRLDTDRCKRLISELAIVSLPATGLLLVTLGVLSGKVDFTEVAVVAVTAAIIIFYTPGRGLSGLLTSRPLQLVGGTSYSFYLLHVIVIGLLPRSGQVQFDFIFQFFVTLVTSYIWFLVFEKGVYGYLKRKLVHSPNRKYADHGAE